MAMPPRAFVFIGLNIARALSLIALILVFASSIEVMVHDIRAVNSYLTAGESTSSDNTDYIGDSTVPNQPAGAFWAVTNRLLIMFCILILFLSEISWPSAFFSRFFPVLGKEFGVGALGIFQCLLGAAVLSHHVDSYTMVSAFFLFSIGCLNFVLGLIFHESLKAKRSVTSWKAEREPVLPRYDPNLPSGIVQRPISPEYTGMRNVFTGGTFTGSENSSNLRNEKAGYGFGRQGEKAAAIKGYLLSRPVEALPRYAPRAASPAPPAPAPTFESSRTAI